MKTSTKNVILGCVLTAALSIPTSIFATKEYIIVGQNQGQLQNQQQSQEQNQIITLNINGNDISYMQQDIENKISELEIENKELETTNRSLNEQINNMYSMSNISLANYKLFLNGIEQIITNDNSIVEYDDHVYIRDDIMSLLIDNINIDKQNNKISVGYNLGETYSLMKVCPPYEVSASYSTDPFTMQGNVYSNGFSIFCSDYRDILFNLDNDFSSLEFDLGHVDGSGDYMCVANFYIDGEYITTISQNSQDDISHKTIPLNYGKILKIEIITKEKPTASPMCATYGFANVILTN